MAMTLLLVMAMGSVAAFATGTSRADAIVSPSLTVNPAYGATVIGGAGITVYCSALNYASSDGNMTALFANQYQDKCKKTLAPGASHACSFSSFNGELLKARASLSVTLPNEGSGYAVLQAYLP